MNQALTTSAEEKPCRDCGATINAKAEICPKCGVRQMAPPHIAYTPSNGKNKIVAAVFAFFLGGVGIHKFYLGQVGWGIIYLLFCWTLVPAIVAFIEGILLLVMSDEKFNEKFG